uniref:Uncharacterized protein n=1 Tax=Oryza nivara TaxID=4536 RepID=A0A0E0I897_ORYNI
MGQLHSYPYFYIERTNAASCPWTCLVDEVLAAQIVACSCGHRIRAPHLLARCRRRSLLHRLAPAHSPSEKWRLRSGSGPRGGGGSSRLLILLLPTASFSSSLSAAQGE